MIVVVGTNTTGPPSPLPPPAAITHPPIHYSLIIWWICYPYLRNIFIHLYLIAVKVLKGYLGLYNTNQRSIMFPRLLGQEGNGVAVVVALFHNIWGNYNIYAESGHGYGRRVSTSITSTASGISALLTTTTGTRQRLPLEGGPPGGGEAGNLGNYNLIVGFTDPNY